MPSPLQHLLRHPVIALCNVLGIALGVAVFLAMQSGNRAAIRAFEASIDLVAGRAHAELRTEGSGFDEQAYRALQSLPGTSATTALVEGYVVPQDRPGDYLHILGVDLFTVPPFQTAAMKPEAWLAFDTESFLTQPGQLLVPQPVADAFGWRLGDTIPVEAAGRRQHLRIAHIVPAAALDGTAAAAGQRTVLMDIAWAQELLDMRGRLSAIQFQLANPSTVSDFLTSLRGDSRLPGGAYAAAPASRSTQVQTMVEGFQLNLHALSMVSMLVGVFLIYNTVAASAVRRRKETGILRALGATRAQVVGYFVLEALMLAIPGVLLGIAAGRHMAAGLVAGLGQTLSSRYLLVSIGSPDWDWPAVAGAALYGIGATIAGAAHPSWRAACLDPVHALHPGTSMVHHRAAGGLRLAGMVIPALATIAFAWAALRLHPAYAFAACLTCVLAFAAASSSFALLLVAGARRVGLGGVHLVGLATESFERSLHRTAPTIAALMASVAMLTGLTNMVASFRASVDAWIGTGMAADIHVTPAANEVLGMRAFLPPEAIALLEQLPGRGPIQAYREEPVLLEDGTRTVLTAVSHERAARFQLLAGLPGWQPAQHASDRVLYANESFARKYQVRPGSTLRLPTPDGPGDWLVVGTIRDYSDDRGRLFLGFEQFAAHWHDARMNSAGFRVAPGTDIGALATALRQDLQPVGSFAVHTHGSLRAKVLEIFDQTFAVTALLRVIAIAVAVIGVVLALQALVLEHAREISLLRALGAGSGQVIRIHLLLAGWVGMTAALLGGGCGMALAWLLVAVVNPAFFGWTIPLQLQWPDAAALPVWVTATAIAAGIYPAWRAARTRIAPALRLE